MAVPTPIVPKLWPMALVFISLGEGIREVSGLLLAGARREAWKPPEMGQYLASNLTHT